MRKFTLITLFLISFGLKIHAQINYSGKIESGFLKFQKTTVNVDPGSNWKGLSRPKIG